MDSKLVHSVSLPGAEVFATHLAHDTLMLHMLGLYVIGHVLPLFAGVSTHPALKAAVHLEVKGSNLVIQFFKLLSLNQKLIMIQPINVVGWLVGSSYSSIKTKPKKNTH